MSAAEPGTDVPGGTSPLVQELLGRIAERVPAGRVAAIREFARAYVRRMTPEEEAEIAAEELFGEIIGIFELADFRSERPFVIRAFNPTLASNGYSTVGSVVETNCEDSPFLVDTVSEALRAEGLEVRDVIHPVVGVERDDEGRIRRILHAREAAIRESVMHFEVSRHLTPEQLTQTEERVTRALLDLRAAVRDRAAMKTRVTTMIEAAQGSGARYAVDEIEETTAFLEWIADGNFVLLGYREYDLRDERLAVIHDLGLGILADDARSRYREPVPISAVEAALRDRLLVGPLLVVSKTNRFSTVHRHAKMDDITVKRVDGEGVVTGALRLLGLFTRKAYMEPASRTPILARKLRQIAIAEDYLEGSYDYKSLIEMFESFPKDELFTAPVEELRRTLVRLLDLQERRQIQLFVRPNLDEGRVAVLVALPRDRFNAELRFRLQDLFLSRFGGSSIDYHLSLGDEEQARIHFTVHVGDTIPQISFAELEQEVVQATRTWDDRLRERLTQLHGEEKGNILADRYAALLPTYYKSTTDIYLSLLDIEQFERLEAGEPFAVALQNELDHEQRLTRVGLYKTGGKVRLSDFMPILEHLGLAVVEEIPTRLQSEADVYLHDFGVLGEDGNYLDLTACGARVADAISAIWRGEAESDSLNRLVITAGLTWQQVRILRAYRTYRLRVGAAFGMEYKNETFARNPHIARGLVELFELRFDPARSPDPAAEEALVASIRADLDRVKSLDEDRILRAQLGLVLATVRTNAFRPGRAHLSFKFASAAVPDMPKPFPLYEIFVYSPEMEGVHLRGGKVARGGIRWSDRKEDYRTEILGLMKAQMVKNAVIVPVGSKGGFVLKHPPADRDALRADVAEQYSTLIRGLLDLTDNLVGGTVVHPEGVRILDEPDPYLVVAADKGTATFSDIANGIAAEYGFWLGDAFASGGSHGYDHKQLGITARGAWESVKRHFRELGHDVATQPFTAVGVGDMSGDVFGNGMLLSEQIRLVAAFDHRDVFIDPTPDPDASFAERRRLFELPASSWNDYDRTKLSPGGGVWSRQEKAIALSADACRVLGLGDDGITLSPVEVMAAILRAPVDLFWNGGIGTFVKAAGETNQEAGDRANDAIRANGAELRCRVVGEGGNLGFTQRGRIEYANAGGRINADFIDNSAGVDTSDHEVNLKILLGIAVTAGDLTGKQRNELLQEAEPDVARHVLYDNYLQAQILSQEAAVSYERIEAYEDLMVGLEQEGLLERELESLPSSEEMGERARTGQSMSRPELCVLLAYAKRSLETKIEASSLPDDPFLLDAVRDYFPPLVTERFGHLATEHPLRRDLASTITSNTVVNDLGITWASRLAAETGSGAAEVGRAYWIARYVSGAKERWDAVEALDGKVDPSVQNVLMVGVDTLVEDVARWYLLNAPGAPLGSTIAEAAPVVEQLSTIIEQTGSETWRAAREAVVWDLVSRGIEEELARRHAYQPELAHAPDIIAVARLSGRGLEEVAGTFFRAGERLSLDWLEQRLLELPETSRWQRWASQAMSDDLMSLRRDISLRVLDSANGRPIDAAFDAFVAGHAEAYERLNRLVGSLQTHGETGLAGLTVALRQVRGLVA
ncbi:MAG: NAD-glutamate dehydrogenase [Gaiellales bacterium]